MSKPVRSELAWLLGALEPYRHPGDYVFCTLPERPANLEPVASIREDEGLTVVVRREIADGEGWTYDFVAAMITLRARSRLDVVGLTAVVSSLLAQAGISCNVMAGYFHDHLFVPAEKVDEALELLSSLSSAS